jgi:hypothetical protein
MLMRRFARHLFTLCSALSLLLCVAVACVGVRSYWHSDAVVYVGPSGHLGVQWLRGRIVGARDNWGTPRRRIHVESWPVTDGVTWGDPNGATPAWLRRLQFDYEKYTASIAAVQGRPDDIGDDAEPPPVVYSSRIIGPLWPACVVFSIAPLIWSTRHFRKRRRRRSGLCVSCGYDLRASPKRCPECGAPAGGADG